jgi:hypothetical protein
MSVKSIWQMACPKSGSDEHIDITALIVVRLTEDETDADAPVHRDHELGRKQPGALREVRNAWRGRRLRGTGGPTNNLNHVCHISKRPQA